MKLFILFLIIIGYFIGYESSLLLQGIIIVISILVLNSIKKNDIGDLFLFSFGIFALIGLFLGNIVYFLNPNLSLIENVDYSKLNPNTRKESFIKTNKLETLICKSNNNLFYLDDYKPIDDKFVNNLSGQIFDKVNCELKK